MTNDKCTCGGKSGESCPVCGAGEMIYWCDTCKQAVPEKRCPICGLKARKLR